MAIKFATYNLENLFQRPAAMSGEHDADGQKAIEDHALANSIIRKDVYSDDDKAKLVRLSKKYGWHKLNPPSNALVLFQKIRGKLFQTPQGGALTVVAKGRADWTGWFELRKQDVKWLATFNTARVIAETKPDILILIEVESRPTFKRFNDQVLAVEFGFSYPHYMVIDGNDDRGIDVGIASRFPIETVRSHVDDPLNETDPTSMEKVFSRDCPEYDISLPGGKKLIVLCNHFKSKRNGDDETAIRRRTAQAKRANAIAQAALARSEFVLMGGDLNDTPDSDPISHIFAGGFKDVSDHPDYPTDRPGTFGTGLTRNKLDYLIMSPQLRGLLAATGIERRGSYHPNTWTPFDTVKKPADEASDHHLVWAKFDL
jgi:endonuclease/exonuclease/phosphatase family metal-dependent hydrolase